MIRTDPGGAFSLIEGALRKESVSAPWLLAVSVGHCSVRLSPEECRNVLYGPGRDEGLRATIWRQVVAEARQEPAGGVGTGRLLVVWLTIPGLYRNLRRILRQSRVERADLEAEAVLAVLGALDSAHPESPDLGGHMIKEAVNRMWSYADRVRREVPVVDVAGFAEARRATALRAVPQQLTDEWELHLTPPPRPDGLAATLRFTDSRTRREGERIGALAHCAGLPDLVFRARRHKDSKLIGTLALSPMGVRR
ncbi:hypothetical protein [Streptomyces sp. NPDC048111]|uniref:hypothetical protein n=1 Tax=Streptomyces sp. NPDC048111 TaxID=3365500 RepID=UPI003715F88C